MKPRKFSHLNLSTWIFCGLVFMLYGSTNQLLGQGTLKTADVLFGQGAFEKAAKAYEQVVKSSSPEKKSMPKL